MGAPRHNMIHLQSFHASARLTHVAVSVEDGLAPRSIGTASVQLSTFSGGTKLLRRLEASPAESLPCFIISAAPHPLTALSARIAFSYALFTFLVFSFNRLLRTDLARTIVSRRVMLVSIKTRRRLGISASSARFFSKRWFRMGSKFCATDRKVVVAFLVTISTPIAQPIRSSFVAAKLIATFESLALRASLIRNEKMKGFGSGAVLFPRWMLQRIKITSLLTNTKLTKLVKIARAVMVELRGCFILFAPRAPFRYSGFSHDVHSRVVNDVVRLVRRISVVRAACILAQQ